MKPLRLLCNDLYDFTKAVNKFVCSDAPDDLKTEVVNAFIDMAYTIMDKWVTHPERYPKHYLLAELYQEDWHMPYIRMCRDTTGFLDLFKMYNLNATQMIHENNPTLVHALCTTGVFKEAASKEIPFLKLSFDKESNEFKYSTEFTKQ